jgi:hypothetical protein
VEKILRSPKYTGCNVWARSTSRSCSRLQSDRTVRFSSSTAQRLRGVPLGMSRIYSECLDSAPSDLCPADVLLRQEPDEEDDEEEDEGDGKKEPDHEEEEDDDDAEDDGYSE